MCDFCVAMTAGEAEHFYRQVIAGEVDQLPTHTNHSDEPRRDLRERQLEELEAGAFVKDVEFRAALYKLCERRKMDMFDFERKLVALRLRFQRPVLSTKEVQAMIADAAERRIKGERITLPDPVDEPVVVPFRPSRDTVVRRLWHALAN